MYSQMIFITILLKQNLVRTLKKILKFKGHIYIFSSIHEMNNFMSGNGNIKYLVVGDKAFLQGLIIFRKERFQLVDQDFGEDLVDSITQANSPKINHSLMVRIFRNEGYKIMVQLFQQFFRFEKVFAARKRSSPRVHGRILKGRH